MEATLTSKGQVTLPKALRDILHLKTGDKIVFIPNINKDGYIIKPKTMKVTSLKNCIKYKGKPISIEDMEQAIIDNQK